ncbi:MAG: hypothetical protein V4550_12775 [Gemmatimonadota bacterium]
MSSKWRLSALVIALPLFAPALSAQHAGHDMSTMIADSGMRRHLMVQAIPLVTRADPSAGGIARTEFTLTQLFAMGRLAFWQGRASLDATLNAEGITMPDGELNTGAHGEGFVDKRHPHTYVHELMGTARGSAGALSWSAAAGRGFAPFGTDDPMMRPFAKYPINHHLSQILERGTLIGAARAGPVIVEAGTFGGDEPTHPSSLPAMSRLGDSWSLRGTILPRAGTEVQASYARVASPEQVAGFGLDQRKSSASARMTSRSGRLYVLGEWSRTIERDHGRQLDVFQYDSHLVEASAAPGQFTIALRLEQTERPEEERLADAFRTPRPSSDLSINGITRWRVATGHIDAPSVTYATVSGLPFVEIARLAASPRTPNSLVTPQRLYGTSSFWMVTVGLRLRAGTAHSRMGRYGVALVN